MNCKESRALMDAYFDDELDLVRSLEMERHLAECPDCARLHDQRRVLRVGLSSSALRHSAPADLKASVRTAIAAQTASSKSSGKSSSKPSSKWFLYRIPAMAAAVVLAAFVFTMMRTGSQSGDVEVVEAHLRSLMAAHLTDVTSTDQHTVKPWFAGKLEFSPTVVDLAAEGFPLTGGRLDYLEHRPVAALVYRRNQHVINAFLWPDPGADAGLSATSRNGYNVVRFTKSHMAYCLVSDLNTAELEQLAKRLAVP